jgi:sugar/nucleoside kinase (ribokinase family)
MGPGCRANGASTEPRCSPDEFFAIPATAGDVRPTGAGDSFAGGFLGYLDGRRGAGESVFDHAVLRQAMAYGSVLASFNVEDFGTERWPRSPWEDEAFRASPVRGVAALRIAPNLPQTRAGAVSAILAARSRAEEE